MRMWKVDPKKLCRQHLLGEHNEMHAFAGTIRKSQLGGKGAIKDFTKTKYITQGLCEVHNIQKRHDELREEMIRRGYNHTEKPLPEFDVFECGVVDTGSNEIELGRRCDQCNFVNDGGPSDSPRKRAPSSRGRIPDSHSGDRGSIPLGATSYGAEEQGSSLRRKRRPFNSV